jgi:phenylpropionate dioxygenase-like ring-hydroxylating dioxygenase large terminal subunit
MSPAPDGLVLNNSHTSLRHWWHPVARTEDVGDSPYRVELLGTPWVIARLGDGLSAFLDRCPHRFAPLSAGRIIQGELECAYHGWRYQNDGHCAAIPALGENAKLPPRACLVPAAGVQERYGLVWIAPEQPRVGLLDLPDWGNPEYALGWLTPRVTSIGAGYMMDNFIDFAHFPFLHRATIGAEAATVIESYEVERDGWSFSFSYTQAFNNHEDPAVTEGTRPLLQTRTMELRFVAPFSLWVRYTNHEQGAIGNIALFVQPETSDRSKLYNCLYRNDLGGDSDALKAALEFEAQILDEDVALQSLYDVWDLPLDPRMEVHTRADRATVELRRILRDLVLADDHGLESSENSTRSLSASE